MLFLGVGGAVLGRGWQQMGLLLQSLGAPAHPCCKATPPSPVPGRANCSPSQNLLFSFSLSQLLIPFCFSFSLFYVWTSTAFSPGVQLGFKLVINNTDVIGKLHFSPNPILFSSQLFALLFPSCSVLPLSVMLTHTFLPHTDTVLLCFSMTLWEGSKKYL